MTKQRSVKINANFLIAAVAVVLFGVVLAALILSRNKSEQDAANQVETINKVFPKDDSGQFQYKR